MPCAIQGQLGSAKTGRDARTKVIESLPKRPGTLGGPVFTGGGGVGFVATGAYIGLAVHVVIAFLLGRVGRGV